jgi:HlyD family secretion protein
MTGRAARRFVTAGLFALLALGGWAAWRYSAAPGDNIVSRVITYFRGPTLPQGFASGNGRIEATEYDVASKRPGRLATVLVGEGVLVEPGEVIARMDTADLEADLGEAQAQLAQAREDKRRALAAVAQRQSELHSSVAAITQRESDLHRADAAIAQRESDVDRAAAAIAQRESAIQATIAAIEQRRSEIERADAAVTYRQTDLQRADAAIAQREAELALARRELERLQTLFARDLIARQQLDEGLTRARTAEAVVIQERAARRAAEAGVLEVQAQRQIAAGALAEAVAQRHTAEAGLTEAQAQRQAAAGAVAEARAQRQAALATLTQEKARVQAAEAAVEVARIDVSYREAGIQAAAARIQRITTDIADSTLKSPILGRVQIRVAQPGEVLGAGGRVVNLIDLSDVYMTFFLPTTAAGRVALGTEIRLVLDAAPQYVIPARASFVADVAQFTPKTVETQAEREKLMFRVKAQISPELLRKHIAQVKTGLPGVAYVRLDPKAEWPAHLAVKLPR